MNGNEMEEGMQRHKNPSFQESETRIESPNSQSQEGSFLASERKPSSHQQRAISSSSSLDRTLSRAPSLPMAAAGTGAPRFPSNGVMGVHRSQGPPLSQPHHSQQPPSLAPHTLSSLLSSRFSATDASMGSGADALNLQGAGGNNGLVSLSGSGGASSFQDRMMPLGSSMRQSLSMDRSMPLKSLLNGHRGMPSHSSVGAPAAAAAAANHGGMAGPPLPRGAAPGAGAAGAGGPPPKANPRDGLPNPMKKPKRPMTAYNFFFRDQHRKIVKEGVSEEEKDSNRKKSKKDSDSTKQDTNKDQEEQQDGSTKKRKRAEASSASKKSKKITFEDLGRTIGQRWKNIDKEELARYTKLAKEDSNRYRKEMEKFYKEETAAIFMGYTGDTNSRAPGMANRNVNPSPAGADGGSMGGNPASFGGLNPSFSGAGAMGGGITGANFGNNIQDSLSHVSTDQLIQALEQQHNQQARENALMNQYRNLSSYRLGDNSGNHLAGGGAEASNQYNLYLLSAFERHRQQERAKEQEFLAMLQGATGFQNNKTATNHALENQLLAEKIGMGKIDNFRDPSAMQANYLNDRLGNGVGAPMPPQRGGLLDNINGLPINHPFPFGDLLNGGGSNGSSLPSSSFLNTGGGNHLLSYPNANNIDALASLLRQQGENGRLGMGNGGSSLPEEIRSLQLLQQQQERAPAGANPGVPR